MKPGLVTSHSLALASSSNISTLFHSKLAQKVPIWHRNNSNPFLTSAIPISPPIHKPSRRFLTLRWSKALNSSDSTRDSTTYRIEETLNANRVVENDKGLENGWRVNVGSPRVPSYVPAAKLSLSEQAFFLLAFIACTTSVAFTSLVIAAVPTLFAMGRAAISLSKLADTAREELPSTMAAIRLSGMEISDLTLELSDLSQEIADGVSKSAQAVQAAKAGIRQIGSLARRQTMSIIEERANLPVISLQPVVAGAAQKTSRAVGQATKTFMNMISRGELTSDNGNENIDRIEI